MQHPELASALWSLTLLAVDGAAGGVPLRPADPAVITVRGCGGPEGLRIMVVTDQYESMVGGVSTVTRELARGLAERGHQVALLVPRARAGAAGAPPPSGW